MSATQEQFGKRIAWICGQSDPASCQLSISQHEFLQAIVLPGWEVMRLNFPYDEKLNRGTHATSLFRASCNNGSQFAADSFALRRRIIGGAVKRLTRSVSELILIAGSCGMQILLNANLDRLSYVRVVGLGPVGWRTPRCPHLILQGEQDYISRLFYRRNACRIDGQGHLDYPSNPDVIAITKNWVCSNTSK